MMFTLDNWPSLLKGVALSKSSRFHCEKSASLILRVELAWLSGYVMDYHATARGLIPGRNCVFIKLHFLRKGQEMGVLSLNDIAVDGTLNQPTNQPTNHVYMFSCGIMTPTTNELITNSKRVK